MESNYMDGPAYVCIISTSVKCSVRKTSNLFIHYYYYLFHDKMNPY